MTQLTNTSGATLDVLREKCPHHIIASFGDANKPQISFQLMSLDFCDATIESCLSRKTRYVRIPENQIIAKILTYMYNNVIEITLVAVKDPAIGN